MTAPIRQTILQVIPRLETGGAEMSTVEIAAAVVRSGGRALVVTEGGRMVDALRAVGGEIVSMPVASKNPIRIARNASLLAGLISREAVSLIHARSRAPAWSALWAARATGIPFVTTFHGAYKDTNPLKRFYNSVMARADCVIANSHFTAGVIRDRYGTRADRLRVIYRGIDATEFAPGRVDPARILAVRARWGIESTRPVILHPARLSPIKGQRHVIEAARLLKQRGELGPAVVVLAGDDQGREGYAAELRSQIAAAGLGDVVRLVGHEGDMAAALLTTQVALLASTEPETFGRVVAEAGAMGCPMIASNIGAPPEVLLAEPKVPRGAITGWLVQPGDPDALAARLLEALSLSDASRVAMGERSKVDVSTRFSLARMQSDTLAAYDDLLTDRRA